MTLHELRKEFDRLSHPEIIVDCIDAIDFYSDFLLKITDKQKHETNSNALESESRLLLQMMLTKTLHLKNAIKGVNFTSKNGPSLNTIIDPTIVASLIRNIYETVGLFNLIFRVNRLGDERLIVYNLWVISGLKYRQRFSSLIHSEENRIKLDTEQKNIETYIQEIENTILYKKLDDRNKAKIQNQIKQKEYLLYFVNDQVIILNWKDLYKTIGGKEDFFNNLYTFFSLYTHPSNVAVFQFRDMYLPETKSFVKMTTFNLKYFYMLGSIFVADYIYLFPDSLKTYDALPLMNQIIINFHNTFARGDSSSINDSWKALG